jgi:uncharacterized protein
LRHERFVRRSRIPASAEEVFRWHAEPGAFQRLTPPWEPVEVVDEGGGLRDGVLVELRVRVGPIRLAWVSRLSDCQPGRSFRDTQVRGPFAFWQHTHSMEPDGDSACWLEDRIEYALPFGFLGRWFGGFFVRRKLERLFDYRHRVTAEAFGPR